MLDRDDIIRMAREAGQQHSGTSLVGIQSLERFAALVAAAECEALADMVANCDPRATPKGIAAAIRARSQA